MFTEPLHLTRPGLFITGTDTGVGKTVVTCGIAAALRRQGVRVGVCKPIATGCKREREGLVSDDALAIAHFADCREPLDVINPVRYIPPMAPAAAAEYTGRAVDFAAISDSLHRLDEGHDGLLVEGVGGLLVPIDHANPRHTVLDLVVALGMPVVVVTRATLGTLNHTAMTVRLLREAGCKVAGLVVNGYDADAARSGSAEDLPMSTNRPWLEKMNRAPMLAVVPRVEAHQVQPEQGRIHELVLDALGQTDWTTIWRSPRH